MAFRGQTWGILPKRGHSRWRFPHHFGSLIVVSLWLLTPVAAEANESPIVDGFTASSTVVAPGATVTLMVEAHDPDCADVCTSGCGLYVRADLTDWSASGGTFVAEDNGVSGSPYTATAEWQAPAVEDTYSLTVSLSDSGSVFCSGRQSATASLDVVVTTVTTEPPVVESLTAQPSLLLPGETSTLLCVASDPDGDPITYSWESDLGTVTPTEPGVAVFTHDGGFGTATVTCTVDDGLATGSDTVLIAVPSAVPEKALTDEIEAPRRLGVDSEGNLYVVDGQAIDVVNLFSGELVHTLRLGDVRSVAVDWKDDLLVGDRNGVALWSRTGAPLLPLDPGTGPGDVVDVAVDRINRRYAALYGGSGRVTVFDETGAMVASFGSTGDGPEQFKSPEGLSATPSGDWLVADSGHGLIKRFDAAGNLLAAFGGLGGGAGEFVQLNDVAADGNGIVYASDTFQSWVQAFEPDGTLREALGGYGDGLGELKTPTGIVDVAGIDGLGGFDRLVVASLNSSSLQVFLRDREPLVGPPPRAEAAVTPLAVDFGDTVVGGVSPGVNVSLSNAGNAILGIHEISVDGPFVASHECSVLQPGEACSIGMVFEPLSAGPQVGKLDLDTSSGPLVVELQGLALVTPDLTLTPDRLDFSDQEIGTLSEPQTLTLTSNSALPLDILAIAASGDYQVSHDCPVTLAAGASCSLQVRFAPASIGDSLPGLASVVSAAAGSPHVAELDGRSIGLIPSFTVRSLDPDGIEEGDGAPVEARFEISLSQPAPARTSVAYQVIGGTAAAGEDLDPVAGRLEFAPGETSQIVSVPIVGDEILEPDTETFSLALSGPLAAKVGVDGVAETTVLDDEVCLGPVLLANADAETLSGSSWIPSWADSPERGWTVRSLSPEPWQGIGYFAAAPSELAELAQEIDLSEFAEAIDGGRQLLDLSARVRTAEDDTARVLVEYWNWDKTALLDRFDSGEVSSPDGWLEVTDLRAAPPDTRWARVRLIGLRLSGEANDAYFDAVSLRTVRAPTVDVADFFAYEGDQGLSSAVLTVRLACPYYQPVFVDVLTDDDTAVAGKDYLPTGATLMVPVGETEDLLEVDLVGDVYDEGHEGFFVDVSGVDPAETAQLTERAVGVILDDDFCPYRAIQWANGFALLPPRLALGGVVYDRALLLGFLTESGSRDVSLAVARELTAARLNLRLGSDPEVLPLAAAADDFLALYPPGSEPGDDVRPLAEQLVVALELYNLSPGCERPPRVGTRRGR